MGRWPTITSPVIPGSSGVVAPYAADIDTTFLGTVRYKRFTITDSQMSTVSSFIRSEMNSTFEGSTMMMAEWIDVPKRFSSVS